MPATEIVNATGKEGCIPECVCTYREKQEPDGEKPMSLVPTHDKYQVSTGYLDKLSGSHGNHALPMGNQCSHYIAGERLCVPYDQETLKRANGEIRLAVYSSEHKPITAKE